MLHYVPPSCKLFKIFLIFLEYYFSRKPSYETFPRFVSHNIVWSQPAKKFGLTVYIFWSFVSFQWIYFFFRISILDLISWKWYSKGNRESFEHGIPELSDPTQHFAKSWSGQKGSSHFQSVQFITRGECNYKVRKQVYVKKLWLNRGHLLTNKQLEN